jgi:hypothetical protein
MAYTHDTAFAIPEAGLTLSAPLVNSTGANVGPAVTTGFVDFGSGYYLWHYEAFPDGHRGAVKFSAGGVLKAVEAINPQEVENADAKTSTRAATADSRFANLDAAVSTRVATSAATWANLDATVSSRATPADVTNALAGGAPPAVTIVSPVVQGGNVQIVRGDDYANADGRALTFNISDPTGNGLPSLTGATVRLKTGLPNRPNLAVLNVIGTVVTATGTTRTVRFELTSAQTAPLLPITYNFDLEATLSTNRVITLLQGQCIVLADA